MDLLNKNDIRVLWNVDKNGKVCEVEIAEFTKQNNPQYLYKKYSYDTGNCYRDWEKFGSLFAVAIELFFRYGFSNKEVEKKFVGELLKVKEVQEELGRYFKHMDMLG